MKISTNTSSRHIFEILREVCASREPLGVAEISRRLGLSLSTAQRALLTLAQSGYLKRHAYVPKYRMGFTAERLVNALLERFTIRPASVSFLRRLAASSRRTASLYVRIGWYSIRLVGIEAGNNPALRTRRLGEAALLDSDAASLAILAFLSAEETERFAAFKSVNSAGRAHTEQLALIGESGFAYRLAASSDGGLESLAFPVKGVDGIALASIAIEGAPDEIPLDQHLQRTEWQEIVNELTQLLRSKRGLCVNPFSHLDPRDVHFGPRKLMELEDTDEEEKMSNERKKAIDSSMTNVGSETAARPAAPADSGATARSSAGMLVGKVAVITGGGSGMGRATVLRFLEEGAAVVLADRDEKSGLETVSLANLAGRCDVRFLLVDVSREKDVRAMIELATREFGRLDCVFNNAGAAGVRAPLTETSLEEFRSVLDTNLLGVFLGLKHGGLALKAQGQGGTLISTSSVAALIKMSPAVYSVAKAAVVKLTQEFACELGPANIRVNSIAPGAILTPMYRGDPLEWQPLLEQAAPLKTVGLPRDIADAAVFLASDLSRYINGTTLVVDGGMLAEGAASWNIAKSRGAQKPK